MESLAELLSRSAARHHKLCPRQVLGVRMGMLAGKVLNLELPQQDKRLFTFVESDGCGMGGIAVATGCFAERRTMRVLDYGKLAATFVDTQTGAAFRIHPHPEGRTRARAHFPEYNRWQSQLEGYQVLPDEDLFIVEPVQLNVSVEKIISQPHLKVTCAQCGEEINNAREVIRDGQSLCRSCAGEGYYTTAILTTQPAKSSIPVVTVIGKSGSGKTTLLEKLIKELSIRGYRLATIKHHSHSGFDIDVPGKDSWRFARAGSCHVVIAAPDKWAAYRHLQADLSLDEITAPIQDVDLILVEGFKQANKPTIEVVRSANSQTLIGTPEQRIAVVSDMQLEVGVPLYALDDVQGLAAFIENRFLTT
ncbi:MAG TPA: molybdopterin-guanine dinucleotide biosynthesis protein B [Anaerolineales bacterium]|nr:molybdopterin-guanine dinucleotide biosynthesis protein B [Anaerolineales bacterium]